MPLFTDGPGYELAALLAIAENRLVFPSKMEVRCLVGPVSHAPKDQPVSDKLVKEAIESLKRSSANLYEKNIKILTKIPPLPKDWPAILKKKDDEFAQEQRKRIETRQKQYFEQKAKADSLFNERLKLLSEDLHEYYYKRFPKHLEEFFLWNTKENGFNAKGEVIRGEDITYEIWIGELRAFLEKGKSIKVPLGDQLPFAYCLAFTVLIDQVMFSSFEDHYKEFMRLTMYPKLILGMTGLNLNPWSVIMAIDEFDNHSKDILASFESYSEFFINDLKEFFDKKSVPGVTWSQVKKAMLNDKDISVSEFGKIFVSLLKRDSSQKSETSKKVWTGRDLLEALNLEERKRGLSETKPSLRTYPSDEVNVIFSRTTPPLSQEKKSKKNRINKPK